MRRAARILVAAAAAGAFVLTAGVGTAAADTTPNGPSGCCVH